MTNDPRGAAMTTHKVRFRCILDIDAVPSILAHNEQDALDALDEEALLEYYGGSFDDMITYMHRIDITEATIV